MALYFISKFSLFIFSAAPAKCESDRDCLKGKAKCIRRECHCTSATAYGDGKTKCERKYKSTNCSHIKFPRFT